MNSRKKEKKAVITVTFILILLSISCLFPFYWMVRSSFLSNLEIYSFPPVMFPKVLRFENYPKALTTFPFHLYLLNTLKIVIPNLIGTLLTSTMAAYSLARLRFPGRDLIFTLVVVSMLVPLTVTIIPVFLGWTALGLSQGFIPLIVPAFLGGGGFNIFLIRQFLLTIPRDIDEAAYIDGAGHVRILFQVLLPLITPVLIAVFLFTFILHWNDVLGPVVYISRNSNNTISQALANFRAGFGTDYKSIMAVSTLSVTPAVVLFLIGQKYFISGIVMTGIKG